MEGEGRKPEYNDAIMQRITMNLALKKRMKKLIKSESRMFELF